MQRKKNKSWQRKDLRKRIRYGQNFIKNPEIAKELVARAGLTQNDLVIEIGPGNGIFTFELVKVVREVIAYEVDLEMAEKLKDATATNLKVVCQDFLNAELPAEPFKCFANLPYNRTADIVRALKGCEHMVEACLAVQLEAAQKYTGIPKETESSILAKSQFDLVMFHNFKREDFEPVPNVECAMFQMIRKAKPVFSESDSDAFEEFVQYGYRSTKGNLKSAYKKIFSHTQWKKLSSDLSFPLKAHATQLTFRQWKGLYDYFDIGVSREKKLESNLVKVIAVDSMRKKNNCSDNFREKSTGSR